MSHIDIYGDEFAAYMLNNLGRRFECLGCHIPKTVQVRSGGFIKDIPVVLCNACGLRFARTQKYCDTCGQVPTKGGCHCK